MEPRWANTSRATSRSCWRRLGGKTRLTGCTYLAGPTVTAVSPTFGPTTAGTSVTITGTNFSAPATVSFGGTAATSVVVVNPTTITANAPAHAVGVVDVRVTTNGGQSPITAADQFTYQALPTMTSLTPSAGTPAGGNSVTITGTNFTGVTAVTWDGVALGAYTVNSATSITVTAPAGTLGTTIDVQVTNSIGTSAIVPGDKYTYANGATVTSVSPTSGPVAGGNTVTITGTNFVAGSTVAFGPTAGTSVNVLNSTTITVVAPGPFGGSRGCDRHHAGRHVADLGE